MIVILSVWLFLMIAFEIVCFFLLRKMSVVQRCLCLFPFILNYGSYCSGYICFVCIGKLMSYGNRLKDYRFSDIPVENTLF